MNKLSDRLDCINKVIDLRNSFIDCQKQSIMNKIIWLNDNFNNFNALRGFFTGMFNNKLFLKLDDKSLQELAEIQGNVFYSQLRNLDCNKVETLPLKIIVQELKAFEQ